MQTDEIKREAIAAARDLGWRVVINGKNAWAGLGNRSGLHSYAQTVIEEKWNKSHKTFLKKLDALVTGDIVEIHRFVNINRDRGNWHVSRRYTIGGNEQRPDFE